MNDSDTKRALLRSGRRLFARHGFDGASIRALTADASANLGAITYHYGSKDALYDAVLEDVAQPLAAAVTAADRGVRVPLDAIEAAVRALAAYFSADPLVPRLFAHELARDHATPGPQRRAMQQIAGVLAPRIRAGQEDGTIVDGHPVLLTFSIVSQPIYWALMRERIRDALGVDPDAGETGAIDHIVRFVRRGLTPPRRTT